MNPFLQLFNRYRPIILLAVSGLCAVIATALIWGQFSDRVRTLEEQARVQEESRVQLLVASRRIGPGEAIRDADIQLAEFPRDVAPANSFSDAASVVGLYTRWPLAPGEPVTGEKVLSTNQGGLAVLIPPEKRAVTIAVDRVSGLETFLAPGSRVDVLAVFEDEQGVSSEVETLLQGVEVLAVSGRFDVTPEERGDDAAGSNQRGIDEASTVTLAVAPDEAAQLVLAANNGRLQLAMRNYADGLKLDIDSVRRTDLAALPDAEPRPDSGGAATNVRSSTPQYVVEVYRGSERSEQAFKRE